MCFYALGHVQMYKKLCKKIECEINCVALRFLWYRKLQTFNKIKTTHFFGR